MKGQTVILLQRHASRKLLILILAVRVRFELLDGRDNAQVTENTSRRSLTILGFRGFYVQNRGQFPQRPYL